MQVIPSILENDINSFLTQLNRLAPYFNSFQIDIADGIYVPNKTVQIEDITKHLTYNMKHLTFDIHLMVKDYETEIKKLEKLRNIVNINIIFIHYSLSPNIQLLTSNFPLLTFGLVLNPQDSLDELYKLDNFKTISCIQIMSVNPGFQGSEFIPETLKKIEQLRIHDYRNNIYLDGAINQSALPLINSLKYKPDFICPGSFLTKAKNLDERTKYLKNLEL